METFLFTLFFLLLKSWVSGIPIFMNDPFYEADTDVDYVDYDPFPII